MEKAAQSERELERIETGPAPTTNSDTDARRAVANTLFRRYFTKGMRAVRSLSRLLSLLRRGGGGDKLSGQNATTRYTYAPGALPANHTNRPPSQTVCPSNLSTHAPYLKLSA